jgi:DNA polymerase-1
VYTEDAKEFFGLPAHLTKETIKKDARKSSKIIHLGRQYGAGKKTTFGIALRQDRSLKWNVCSALCDAFDKRYARTVEWWDEEMERVMKTGYSETRIMNRRRSYPRPPANTDTSNYPIQGTAADVKNLALIALDAALTKYKMKSRIILDLHDAIYLECPKAEAPTAEKVLVECMEQEHTVEGKKVIFKAEAGRAFRWSDLKL